MNPKLRFWPQILREGESLFNRDAGKRARRRKQAKAQLARLFEHPENVLAIHYSCESFYDRPDGSSPRITSIAVRNLASGQTVSFSIHQLAERDKKLNPLDIEDNYNDLEKKMLKEFYEFVDRHMQCIWLHWNMRDINFGFAALAHRFKCLGGKPVEIPENQLVDLSRLLVALYGVGYIGHPRLTKLVERNKITNNDFLTGPEEAEAFVRKEYFKLHQSTLRKVDIFANIAERVLDGTLQTDATRSEIYGSEWVYWLDICKDHWIIVLLAIASSITGIIGFIVSSF